MRLPTTFAGLLILLALSQATGRAQDLTPREPSTPPASEGKPGESLSAPMRDGNAGSERGLTAGWENGFFVRSADRAFLLRITGQIQADYHAYLNPRDQLDVDSFLLRRARLGIEATMFEFYEFRLLPDFAASQPRVQDAYMNVHYWDAFQVEIGKFKQPVSYEQLIQDRFVPTLERSMIDQLVPGRDMGVMLHGQNLLGNRLDFAAAVSNGEFNGESDTNEHKDVAGRVALRPLNDPSLWPVVRGLQLGISGGVGVEQEAALPTGLRTPAGVRWFQFNPAVRANGVRERWTPEVSYFYGPLGVAAQYYAEEQKFSPTGSGPSSQRRVEVPFEGGYILATLLLTGEERTTYSQPIVPHRPFDPRHCSAGPGAWELVVRASRLEVGDEAFAPGSLRLADPRRNSSGATELTAGFNWYLNAWVRTQFNWEHAWFDDPVQLGSGPQNLTRHQDSLLARFQIIF